MGSHSIYARRRLCGGLKKIGLLVSYRPLAHDENPNVTRNCLTAPVEKLGPRRHGERDREAPRGAEDRRRAGRQAPQGVDLELSL